MSKLQITISSRIKFSDLDLAFYEGDLSFKWEPIVAICAHNGLSVDIFKRGPEDNVVSLIWAWYAQHRAEGGAPDPVAEEYIAEVQAEMETGFIVDVQNRKSN